MEGQRESTSNEVPTKDERERERSRDDRSERSKDKDRESSRDDKDRERSRDDRSERSRDDKDRERSKDDRSERSRDKDRERSKDDRSERSRDDKDRKRDRDRDRDRDDRPRDRDSSRREGRRSRDRYDRSSRDRDRSRRSRRSVSRSPTPERRRKKKPSNFSDAPPEGMAAVMMMENANKASGMPPNIPGMNPAMMSMLASGGIGGGFGGVTAQPDSSGMSQMAMAMANNSNDPAVKTLRELFVGNTPEGTQEFALMEFLNAAIQKVRLVPTPGNPIVQCRVSNKFAFIELRTIEEANLCLSLTGIPYMGNMLKVGRPSKYTGPQVQAGTWQQLTGAMPVIDASIDPNTKLHRELFIGNTTPDMSEVELMEFLGAAMQQVGLTTQPGNPILSTRLSGKFAFVEVRSVEETNNALNMNGIPYMGQNLRVGRPTKYTGPSVPHLEWPELLAKYTLPQVLLASPIESIYSHSRFMAGDLTQPAMPSVQGAGQGWNSAATCVLKLGNMVTPEDLVDDEEYKDILDDTKEECGKFGQVVSVVIPRYPQDAGMGKVFVEFSSSEAAMNAAQVLSGRTFDGKQVEATFYDEKSFAEENYSL